MIKRRTRSILKRTRHEIRLSGQTFLSLRRDFSLEKDTVKKHVRYSDDTLRQKQKGESLSLALGATKVVGRARLPRIIMRHPVARGCYHIEYICAHRRKTTDVSTQLTRYFGGAVSTTEPIRSAGAISLVDRR